MTRFLQDPIARTYDCDIFPHFLNQKEKERKKLMQKNEKRRDNRIQKRRKKGKCGQFAISVLLHALTITLFRQPPLPIHLAPASLSNFSSPSGCEHEEQIWSTPVLFGDVSGKKQKRQNAGKQPPLSSEFMISILAMCIFFECIILYPILDGRWNKEYLTFPFFTNKYNNNPCCRT